MDLIRNRPRQACRSKVLTQICLLTLVVALLFGHVDKVSAQGEAPPTTTVESFQNGTEAITEAKTTFTGTTLAATDASSSYTSPSDTSPSPTNFDPTSSATFSEISNIIPQESLASSTPTFQTSVLSLADTPSNVDSSTPAGASPAPLENVSMDSSSNGVTSSILESSQGADVSSTMYDSPSQTIASSVQPTETVRQSSEFQTPSLSTNAVEALTTPVAFQTSEMPSAPVYTGQESTHMVSDWSDSPVQDTIKASDWSASPTQDTNTASDWSVSLTQDTIKASDWSESFQDSSLPATIQSSSTEFVFPTSASNNFPPSSVSSTELLTTLDLSSSVLEPGPLTLSDVTLTEMHPTSVVSDSSSSQVVLSEYSSEAKLDSSTVVPNMDASSQVISPTPLQSDSSDVTQLVPSQSMESVSESWTTSPQASSVSIDTKSTELPPGSSEFGPTFESQNTLVRESSSGFSSMLATEESSHPLQAPQESSQPSMSFSLDIAQVPSMPASFSSSNTDAMLASETPTLLTSFPFSETASDFLSSVHAISDSLLSMTLTSTQLAGFSSDHVIDSNTIYDMSIQTHSVESQDATIFETSGLDPVVVSASYQVSYLSSPVISGNVESSPGMLTQQQSPTAVSDLFSSYSDSGYPSLTSKDGTSVASQFQSSYYKSTSDIAVPVYSGAATLTDLGSSYSYSDTSLESLVLLSTYSGIIDQSKVSEYTPEIFPSVSSVLLTTPLSEASSFNLMDTQTISLLDDHHTWTLYTDTLTMSSYPSTDTWPDINTTAVYGSVSLDTFLAHPDSSSSLVDLVVTTPSLYAESFTPNSDTTKVISDIETTSSLLYTNLSDSLSLLQESLATTDVYTPLLTMAEDSKISQYSEVNYIVSSSIESTSVYSLSLTPSLTESFIYTLTDSYDALNDSSYSHTSSLPFTESVILTESIIESSSNFYYESASYTTPESSFHEMFVWNSTLEMQLPTSKASDYITASETTLGMNISETDSTMIQSTFGENLQVSTLYSEVSDSFDKSSGVLVETAFPTLESSNSSLYVVLPTSLDMLGSAEASSDLHTLFLNGSNAEFSTYTLTESSLTSDMSFNFSQESAESHYVTPIVATHTEYLKIESTSLFNFSHITEEPFSTQGITPTYISSSVSVSLENISLPLEGNNTITTQSSPVTHGFMSSVPLEDLNSTVDYEVVPESYSHWSTPGSQTLSTYSVSSDLFNATDSMFLDYSATPTMDVSFSSGLYNESQVTPTMDVSFSSGLYNESQATPTLDISFSSGLYNESQATLTMDVSFSSGLYNDSQATPTFDISFSSGLYNESQVTPTLDISSSSGLYNESQVTPTLDISFSSGLYNESQVTPTLDISFSSGLYNESQVTPTMEISFSSGLYNESQVTPTLDISFSSGLYNESLHTTLEPTIQDSFYYNISNTGTIATDSILFDLSSMFNETALSIEATHTIDSTVYNGSGSFFIESTMGYSPYEDLNSTMFYQSDPTSIQPTRTTMLEDAYSSTYNVSDFSVTDILASTSDFMDTNSTYLSTHESVVNYFSTKNPIFEEVNSTLYNVSDPSFVTATTSDYVDINNTLISTQESFVIQFSTTKSFFEDANSTLYNITDEMVPSSTFEDTKNTMFSTTESLMIHPSATSSIFEASNETLYNYTDTTALIQPTFTSSYEYYNTVHFNETDSVLFPEISSVSYLQSSEALSSLDLNQTSMTLSVTDQLTETLLSLSNESMATTVTDNSSLTYMTDAILSTNVSVTMSMLETAADFNTTSTLYIADSGMSTFLWSSYLTLNENLTSSTPFFTELSSESQMSFSSQDLSEIYYSTNETYSTSIITDSLSQFVSKTDISVSTISWYFNETSTSMIDTESLITANYSDYFTSDLMPTFTSTINVTESFASLNTSDMPGFSYSSVDVNSSAIFLPITPSVFSDFTTLFSSFIASENVSSYSYYTANETSLISSSPSIELSELSTGINATEVPLLSTMSGSEVSQLSTYVSEMATTISNITEMLSSVSMTTAVDTSSIVYNSSDITPTPPLLSSFTLSSMESSSLLSSLEYTASSQNESASTVPVSSTSQYSSVFYTPSPLPTDSFVMESSNSSSGIIILPTPSSSQSSVSMSSSGSPTVTIMTTSVEVSSAFPNITSSAITPSTPTTQKPGTTVPTIVNSQNMTEFWVITRFKVRTNVDVNSQQFKSSIEKGLANSYHLASIRSEEIKNGTYVPLVRKRREATATDNPNIKVQVVSATRQESTSASAVDVVYVVEQNGQLVPATKAAEQMKLLTEQEVAIQTGQVVSLTAQPYITPASSGEDNTKWIILGCVLGGALLIAVIIIIVCCCCCGNRCCRKDEDEKTTKFQDARLVKVTKRNTDHDEYVDDDPSKNGKMSFTSRKAKYAVSQDSDMEDPLYSDARKEPTKVPRKTRSSLQPSESQEMRVENERKGRADTPQRSRRKKNRDMETEHDIRSVYASQMASLQTGDPTMYSQEEFTLNAHPTVEEEGDLLENAEEERRKNKQRLRAKKLRENGLPSETDDATLAAYEKAQKELDKVLGPRSKADEDTFKKQKGKGKKKKDGKKGEDNEGYEENEKPEETLEEARQRMHKLLDDAFSLISHSKSSIGNKVQPSNEDEKNTSQPIISREDHGVQASFDAHPNEGPKHTPLRVIRTHEPYDSSGLVTWSPYRASDEIATISLPHTQTNLNTSPPQQEKLNTSTFTESMPSTARTNYYATQPGEPIVIRSKNLETSLPPNGSHHRKSSNSQNQTKHSETFQNPMYENTLPLRSLDRYSDPYDGLSSLQDLPVSHLTEPNRKSGDALIDIRAHTAPQRGEKKDYDEMDVIKGSIQPGASPQPLINSLREELQTLSNKRMAESVPLKTNGTTLKDIASNRKTSGL